MSETFVQGVVERVLSHPRTYLALQWLLGSHRLRKLCVDKLGAAKGERLLDLGCGPAYVWMARFLARHDRGRFVTDEAGYRRIAQQCFREVSSTVVRNSGRLPSTEIIMMLRAPIAEPAASLG